MDLYFETFDGQAVTVEDFLSSFERASGRDLSGFFRWYGQAGTPEVRIESEWDEASGALTLRLAQTTPPTPGQPDKASLVTPIRLGLLDEEGRPQAFTPARG